MNPTPLLTRTAQDLKPGRALDLACGAGKNALWLAERGWKVTAVDGSAAAIEVLRESAGGRVDARVADLEKGEYTIEESCWELIVISYYLQSDLFEPALRGLAPGGVLIVIVLLAESGEEPPRYRLRPGELVCYFDGCEILHSHEGRPTGQSHHRAVAEIVVRRPL